MSEILSASRRAALPAASLLSSVIVLGGAMSVAAPTAAGSQSASDSAENSSDSEDTEPIVVSDEIIVTAEKRESRLQDVPLAVTALTGDVLEGLDLRTNFDLPGQIVNFEMKAPFNNAKPSLFLRGVGTNDFNSNAAGTVGTFIDGVYVTGQAFQTFDLERVEVLRGPQSTLYGKNTIGGAVNFIARKPSGDTGGYARFTLGRFDHFDVEGAVETPLGRSRHAFRFAFVSNHRDGYVRNVFLDVDENDVEANAARALLRLVPSDNVTLLINVHGGTNRSGAKVFQSRGLIDGADALGYVESPDPYEAALNFGSAEDIDLFGSSITLDWFLPTSWTLTAISAWEESDTIIRQDGDASPNSIDEYTRIDTIEQFTQELRLTSQTGARLAWISGAYYLKEDLFVDNEFDLFKDFGDDAFFVLFQDYTQDTESFAVFAHAAYQLAERFTLRAGLRHTWESKDFTVHTGLAPAGTFFVPLIDVEGRVSDAEFSGEIGLDFRPHERLLVFGNVRRGFKSGGFNGGAFFSPEQVSPVRPEFLTSYEIGLKSSWHANRLRFNATGFFYDYRDLQVFDLDLGATPLQILDNASDARVLGLELEIEGRTAGDLLLALGLGLLDTEYEDFVRRDGVDFSGNRLVSAPKASVNVAASKRWQIGAGLLAAVVDYHYKSSVFFDSTNRPRIGFGGYGLVNGRLSFDLPGGRYTLGLWGRNLTDKVYLTDIFDLEGFGGFDDILVGEPRTYGVDVMVRF